MINLSNQIILITGASRGIGRATAQMAAKAGAAVAINCCRLVVPHMKARRSGGCSVWLWQRPPEGLRNLLPPQNNLTLALELGEAGPEGYLDVLFYRRAMQDAAKQSLAQVRLQWDGKAYHEQSKTFLGDYLKTPLPASAWRVMK